MKDDYLWDRSGSDPEIEELEGKLGLFRNRYSYPPRLPEPAGAGKQVVLPLFARLGFAAAVLAVVSIVSLPAYDLLKLGASSPEISFEAPGKERSVDFPDPPSRGNTVKTLRDAGGLTRSNRSARGVTTSVSEQAVKRKTLDVPITAENGPEQPKTGLDERLAALTAEERQAYDALMLALSITSEKLRIVREKVSGTTEPAIAGEAKSNLPRSNNK